MVFLFSTGGTGPDLTDFPLGISPDWSLKEHVCRFRGGQGQPQDLRIVCSVFPQQRCWSLVCIQFGEEESASMCSVSSVAKGERISCSLAFKAL